MRIDQDRVREWAAKEWPTLTTKQRIATRLLLGEDQAWEPLTVDPCQACDPQQTCDDCPKAHVQDADLRLRERGIV